MAGHDELLGVWTSCLFPTHEASLALLASGKGFFFFYRGSEKTSPFVDEFEWSQIDEARL
jgi:hypothetical protein